jgi:hypothetical protein
VLTTATAGALSYTSYSRLPISGFAATIAPGFDYFTSNDVSVGLDVALGYSSGNFIDASGETSDSSRTSIGVAPRVGVNVPIGERVSLYGQAAIGYGGGSAHVTTRAASNDHSFSGGWVALSAPVLFHAASHFFAGAGPYWSHDLSRRDQNDRENNATLLGARFVLGGWI